VAKKDVAKKKPAAKPKLAAKAKTKAKPKVKSKGRAALRIALPPVGQPMAGPGSAAETETAAVLDRLWSVVMTRREADPTISHSARLLSRGTAKVAQKFGEEAVECLIEAVAGNREALIAESADVLYHLLVMWVNAGIRADAVWAELARREGFSGIAEKTGRVQRLSVGLVTRTRKIP
jgi:phosphoribosyl-ATP pyrophosphohydrolase